MSRVDLHCHSTASQVSKLGVQRSLGLPECATAPEEVYALAKRRGMDFVTITDHDAIDGALALAARYDDAFVSEELTAWFAGEPQAVHLLCLGITPDDHEWLQAHARDLEEVAEYVHDRRIACAVAHPFYSVEAPLLPRHRRRLSHLFGVWETRNGSRAPELNAPAAIYMETYGGAGTGGSDDHAGVDIGRTWTEAPPAGDWREFLAHVRAGRCEPAGEQGSAAKWTHSALALAMRALGRGDGAQAPDPGAVMRILERLMVEGDARRGQNADDLSPADARALLRSWLAAVGLDFGEDELIAFMQADGFSHADLFRRARRRHERKLVEVVERAVATGTELAARADPADDALARLAPLAHGLFDACLAALPYAPSNAFLAREKGKLGPKGHGPLRVALVADAVGGTHGVTRTIEEIRERGVPGYEVEVIGTDPNVDRRLSAVAEVDIPFYEGLRIGVPSMPAVVEAIAEGRYDIVHLCAPGPAGVTAAAVAHLLELPVLGSYHTELAAYAGLRTGREQLEAAMGVALSAFYERCQHVLSPSRAADRTLAALGVSLERVGRWDRGVDTGRFDPARRQPGRFGAPGDGARVNVLYAGRLTREKGVDLLGEAFAEARARDSRLHLLVAGGGPEEGALRRRLGADATFLGWQRGLELATTFASADLFCFCSETDTFGQVILEAQASGVPVVAVRAGGPAELIEDGHSGLLVAPDARAFGGALAGLAASRAARERLARGGLAAVAERTWAASLRRLADGYDAALAAAGRPGRLLRAA